MTNVRNNSWKFVNKHCIIKDQTSRHKDIKNLLPLKSLIDAMAVG
ncbi:TPA: hypothetical protein ACROBW_002241 [Staphylococcus aureus]